MSLPISEIETEDGVVPPMKEAPPPDVPKRGIRPMMKKGLWQDHFADLSAIRHGADVRERAAVGEIAASHPYRSRQEEAKPMENTRVTQRDRILGFFQDGKEGRATDVAATLGMDAQSTGEYLAHLAKRGDLKRIERGRYAKLDSPAKKTKEPAPAKTKTPEPKNEIARGPEIVHYVQGRVVRKEFIEATCAGCGSTMRIKEK